MTWRLGIDLGPASIGWVALRLDTEGVVINIIDGGVRLFSDGRNDKDNEPFNLRRRQQRGMRRNKDRRQQRVQNIEKALVRTGLLTSHDHDVRHLDPYQARAEAATQPVAPEKIARALIHLSKGRGFKSNRKTDSAEEQTSAFKQKLETLTLKLDGVTLGQFLHAENQNQLRQFKDARAKGETYIRQGLRFRGETPLYPTRAMVEEEFDRIRQVQQPHNSLSDADWDDLRYRLLYQRPLRPQDRGKCTFYVTEDRALKALPSSQSFVMEQTLANLKIQHSDFSSSFLTPVQRDAVRSKLLIQQSLSFQALLKLKIGKDPVFPDARSFNLDTIANDKLAGNLTHIALSKVLGAGVLADMPLEEQDELVIQLIEAEVTDELVADLRADPRFSRYAVDLASLRFPGGTLNLSTKATMALLPLLKGGLGYSDAVADLKDDNGTPLHHSRLGPEKLPTGTPLPYYGAILHASVMGGDSNMDPEADPERHFGRIANPSVHVALNQIRQVINRLIQRFGTPAQVHIELAREIAASADGRSKITRQQAKNKKENERLRELAQELGVPQPSRTDLLRLKLWEQLNTSDQSERRCIYTGRRIAATDVLSASVEIEHILPYGRTLDDRISNKVLAFKDANALKGDKTPFEAFGDNKYRDKGMVWEEIIERAKTLYEATAWRFGPDAIERFEQHGNGFVARALVDTSYIGRLARQYAELLTGPNGVVVVTGRHTANLRHDWGLNRLLASDDDAQAKKNRNDHRHHLIDAFVVALTTRSVLQHMARDAKYSASDHRLQRGVLPLSDTLRDRLQEVLETATISMKPDHSAQGQFFQETAYGLGEALEGMDTDRRYSTRIDVRSMANEPLKIISAGAAEGICDPEIRAAMEAFIADHGETGEKRKVLIEQFIKGPLVKMIEQRGIRRLKIKIKNDSVQPIASAPFKGYAVGNYAFVDIWMLPPNTRQKSIKYVGVFVDRPSAMGVLDRGETPPRPDHPGAKRLMRLFKNDTIAVDDKDHGTQMMRVYGFSTTNNKLDVRSITEAGGTQDFKSINILGHQNLRRLNILPDGTIRGQN